MRTSWFLMIIILSVLLFLPTAIITLVNATNESSYKYGYSAGKTEWQSCAFTNGDGDCSAAFDSCAHPIHFFNGTTVYNSQPGYSDITNITACVHGYLHAWNHVL